MTTADRDGLDRSNLRWCSDSFEIGFDNSEKVPVAFALDRDLAKTYGCYR